MNNELKDDPFEVTVGKYGEFTVRGNFSNGQVVVVEIEQLLDNGQAYLVTNESREFHGENFQYFKEKYWADICEKVDDIVMI